jgi:hypothetical protein
MSKRIWLAVLFALFLGGLPLLYAETIHWQVDKPVGGQRLGYVVQNLQSDGTAGDTHVTVSGTVTAAQAILGALKTAATLYQTDGVPVDITHPVYTSPATGTITPAMSDVTLSDTIVNLMFVDTTTVVSYVLPAKTVAYEFWTGNGTVFYWAFSTSGLSSNRMKQPTGIPYNTFQLGSEKLYTGTLYFQDATGSDTINLHIVTKP